MGTRGLQEGPNTPKTGLQEGPQTRFCPFFKRPPFFRATPAFFPYPIIPVRPMLETMRVSG